MLKLNNPGNIRVSAEHYKGEVTPGRHPSFKTFQSMAWGYRAMFVVLRTYMQRHGLTTIEEIIGRWAPPTENATTSYVLFVATRTGINPKRSLTFCYNDIAPIVSAMSYFENGQPADTDDIRAGWQLL